MIGHAGRVDCLAGYDLVRCLASRMGLGTFSEILQFDPSISIDLVLFHSIAKQ